MSVSDIEAYAIVRKTDGKEWIDISAISGDAAYAMRKAKEINVRIPEWARANPIERTARVVIHEIDP